MHARTHARKRTLGGRTSSKFKRWNDKNKVKVKGKLRLGCHAERKREKQKLAEHQGEKCHEFLQLTTGNSLLCKKRADNSMPADMIIAGSQMHTNSVVAY
jgi:hypothetical protein